ncbi:DUF4817 domain-containing protein [Trichonephila clavipes]|uniref:DUF4817 domain-containing protein n=1 Tax=Trichonephila clavipes TaxID=2585209 RepID=A0A8X6WJI7_TRICX|nr:DUF4817 domain-containing protein [Trichonephila clavipes]
MSQVRQTFEQRKRILTWYWKFENISEVYRHLRQQYKTELPACSSNASLHNKFKTYGTIKDMHKGRSGWPRTSTSETSSVAVLESFTLVLASHCTRGTCMNKASVDRIFQRTKCKIYESQQLLHTLNKNDADRRIQFCEWYLTQVEYHGNFVSLGMWSLLLMWLLQERGTQK